jgi:Zn finger protein HypA/HybF involved in hydrogenase expression
MTKTKTLYLLQAHKFGYENIEATLACPKCEEIFKKEFPLDLEGQITEFKCPVCNSASEADLPSKRLEQQEEFEADLYEVGEDNSEEEFDKS